MPKAATLPWPSRSKEYQREWKRKARAEDPEKHTEYMREWRRKHPGYYNEWYAKNRERAAKYQRDWKRDDYAKDPERRKQYLRERRAENPELFAGYDRKRLGELAEALIVLYGDSCACCGVKFLDVLPKKGKAEAWELDHISGPNGKKWKRARVDALKHPEEYQLLCWRCNGWKDNGPFCPCKHWDEKDSTWRERLGEAYQPAIKEKIS